MDPQAARGSSFCFDKYRNKPPRMQAPPRGKNNGGTPARRRDAAVPARGESYLRRTILRVKLKRPASIR